jgi:hypothetical protein
MGNFSSSAECPSIRLAKILHVKTLSRMPDLKIGSHVARTGQVVVTLTRGRNAAENGMQCVRQQEMLKTERCWKQVRAQDFHIPLPTRVNLASFILHIIFMSAHRQKLTLLWP